METLFLIQSVCTWSAKLRLGELTALLHFCASLEKSQDTIFYVGEGKGFVTKEMVSMYFHANPTHIAVEAFGWDSTVKMHVCLWFMFLTLVLSQSPSPRGLLWPACSRHCLLFRQSEMLLNVHWLVLKRSHSMRGTISRQIFLPSPLNKCVFNISSKFSRKTQVMPPFYPWRRCAGASHIINVTPH